MVGVCLTRLREDLLVTSGKTPTSKTFFKHEKNVERERERSMGTKLHLPSFVMHIQDMATSPINSNYTGTNPIETLWYVPGNSMTVFTA